MVEITTDALVDDGKQSSVSVQPDAAKHRFTVLRLQVTHWFIETAADLLPLTTDYRGKVSMVRKLIAWALDNPIAVILGALFLAMVGCYSFMHVNVEAYPDPAPAIVEVLALFPGASAEEVEREVTIPLEVTFSGMPGLKKINSKSLFGLSDLKMTWHYGSDYTYYTARQEVINRIATISQPLPPNVTPVISPESPTGEIFRYILKVPKDPSGKEIYTLNDIKALQDWVLERELRRVPRVVDLTSFGGTVRRYEVQPDPDRLRR